MNDLISREALKKAMTDYEEECGDIIPKKYFDFIDNAPTVPQDCSDCKRYDFPYVVVKFDKEQMQEIVDKAKAGVLVSAERPQGEPVIKCQDCKYRVKEWREDRRMKEKGYWVYGCKHFGEIIGFWGFGGNDNEFCSDAERKGGAE